MATAAEVHIPGLEGRRDWRAAFTALRRLLADGNDTVQVFRIMRALNAGSAARGYEKLLKTPEGGRLAYQHVELSERFTDPTFLAQFEDGTVGAAYRNFLDQTGYSAKGLADISYADNIQRGTEHPHAWFGRRERDIHDVWHVLTGYRADEPLGEACLVAFSYAQTKGLGWAFIGWGAALKSLRVTRSTQFARAVREGYRHGKAAKWLHGEDYERLFAEGLEAARARLNIAAPTQYRAARDWLVEAGFSGL